MVLESIGEDLNRGLKQGADLARRAGMPVDAAIDTFQRRIRPFALRKVLENAIGFVRRTGVQVVTLERGRVVCRMPIKGNVNHIGTMYAGALFTLAEIPGGGLYLTSFDSRRYVPIVTEMTIRFLRPARGDVSLEISLPEEEILAIQAAAEADGKAEFVLEGELKAKDGEVVATSFGRYQLRPRRS